MPTLHQGDLDGKSRRFGIVVARYSKAPGAPKPLGEMLLDGCVERLLRAGVSESAIEIAYVPGSFEIPVVAKALAAKGSFDAIIALGAVIRGDTAHFDFVAGEAARGVARVGLESGVPVIFGVLTCDTPAQALERVGGAAGHKGIEAAEAALETASVLRRVARGGAR